MNLLLDTHVIIWTLTNDPQLSESARSLISDPGNMIFISTVSLWEIALKNQKASHLCPYHEAEILQYCLKAGYQVAGLRPEHVLALRTLQVRQDKVLLNHDLFDRMLIAQAKSEKWKLLSHDRNFEYYDETCICQI